MHPLHLPFLLQTHNAKGTCTWACPVSALPTKSTFGGPWSVQARRTQPSRSTSAGMWNVDGHARMELSGNATTSTFVCVCVCVCLFVCVCGGGQGRRAPCLAMRAPTPRNMVLPPESTTLANRSFWMPTSHLMMACGKQFWWEVASFLYSKTLHCTAHSLYWNSFMKAAATWKAPSWMWMPGASLPTREGWKSCPRR